MGADAGGRAVAFLGFRALSVQLDELSVVNIAAERALNCFQICLVARRWLAGRGLRAARPSHP